MSCRRYFPEEDTDDYEPAPVVQPAKRRWPWYLAIVAALALIAVAFEM